MLLDCMIFLASAFTSLAAPRTSKPEFKKPPFTEEGIKLWEDMILTEEQVRNLNQTLRKGIRDLRYRWPNASLPYEISQSSEKDRQVIIDALNHWMSNTCIVFKEVPLGSKGHRLIFTKKDGCGSSVGMQSDVGQEVSIGDNCNQLGIVAHEVGHAIGFYHEHSRPDRNNYVKLFLENCDPNQIHAFDIYSNTDINDYGIPYDLGSLMHYGSYYFSKNGKNTMVTLDPMKQLEIGQTEFLSFYDIQLANLMYNCSDHCPFKPSCKNGGYVDQHCTCRCPPRTKGTYCETIVPPPAPSCGGVINAPKTIKSPNYPNHYPEKSKCIWQIKAPLGKRIKAVFKKFDIYKRNKQYGLCMSASLELRTKDIYEGDIYCGTELQGEIISSFRNEMYIFFKSEIHRNTGFEIQVSFI